jgi:hypothetical protein
VRADLAEDDPAGRSLDDLMRGAGPNIAEEEEVSRADLLPVEVAFLAPLQHRCLAHAEPRGGLLGGQQLVVLVPGCGYTGPFLRSMNASTSDAPYKRQAPTLNHGGESGVSTTTFSQ